MESAMKRRVRVEIASSAQYADTVARKDHGSSEFGGILHRDQNR
jgi:hypothetical protein